MRRLPFLLLVLAMALVLAACGQDDPIVEDEQPLDLGTTVADLPDLVEEVAPSVVSILRSDGGEGSGVIWSSDGIIVTNNHVIEGADEIVVAFADGVRVPAEVIATDPRTDLAVIAADREGVPPADFREDLPQIGELALALGNPLGFENTVTVGIVSGLHRAIPGAAQVSPALVDLVQTDAAISPGNSGGALVDGEGQVIGVNVAYLPPNPPTGRGAVNLGFAIPGPTVENVVTQLLEEGVVQHAYLGIQPATLTPSLGERFGIEEDDGVLVLNIVERGPAAQAGLEPGDLITEIDGESLETAEDLLGALRQEEPGQTVTLTVVRGDEEQTVSVALEDLPAVNP